MFLMIFTIFFQTQIQAAQIPINENELLSLTKIDKNVLYKANEKSLEEAVFMDENGMSCGLEEFSIEGYTIIEGTANNPTRFEVINLVTGPTNYCGASGQYKCYTPFYKKNEAWNTLGAECETSPSYED